MLHHSDEKIVHHLAKLWAGVLWQWSGIFLRHPVCIVSHCVKNMNVIST